MDNISVLDRLICSVVVGLWTKYMGRKCVMLLSSKITKSNEKTPNAQRIFATVLHFFIKLSRKLFFISVIVSNFAFYIVDNQKWYNECYTNVRHEYKEEFSRRSI